MKVRHKMTILYAIISIIYLTFFWGTSQCNQLAEKNWRYKNWNGEDKIVTIRVQVQDDTVEGT